MIVSVSIVDKHKPVGHAHVGTHMFEIDYPGDSHFDFMTGASPIEDEHKLRPFLGRLLRKGEVPDQVDGHGNPVKI